jgi:uncharacterized protein (TIGR02284 family)
MKNDKKIIEVLNDLIKINNDRIQGYQKAAENVEASDARLKSLFYQISEESYDCRRELSEQVTALGGEPAEDSTTAPGKIYRVWMDVKVTFSGNDTQSTLNACEFGEDSAQKAYKEALALGKDFPREIIDMIQKQKNLLKMSHDLIRNMRDEYKEVEHH